MTQGELAANIGSTPGSVGNWESGLNLPGPSYLRKIADYFGVPIEYVLGEPGPFPEQQYELRETKTAALKEGEESYYKNPQGFLDELNCRDPACYALEWSGDGMEPKYFSGDLLIVSPNAKLENGDLVVAKTVDETLLFKIYHRGEAGRGKVVLTSYNTAFPPLEFEMVDFRFIYPVWSVLRFLKKRGQMEQRKE